MAHGDHLPDHPAALRESGLRAAVLLTAGFAVVEAIGGWLSGSLALIADAGHMITDSVALILAWAAATLSRRPPDARHSYGFRRAEVLAALINALVMLGIVAFLVYAAIGRLQNPRAVLGGMVMLIAAIGLVVNVVVLMRLRRADRGALNTRGALIHVVGDLLGSVAALTAGAVIWITGWTPIDPLLTLVIAALIVFSALRLLRDVVRVLMEAVPSGVDLEQVRKAILATAGVTGMHDLHVWTLAGDRLLLSAHVQIDAADHWPDILPALQRCLRDGFGIGHATLQPEPPEYTRALSCDPCADGGSAPLDDHAH
ncbi:MAG TPA: cation diffusion facilitator family transporter [Xanthomonadaceae bacterium]|nr:cation diffusion facilitator family transporter [Xanthomonadaceae bacterium]